MKAITLFTLMTICFGVSSMQNPNSNIELQDNNHEITIQDSLLSKYCIEGIVGKDRRRHGNFDTNQDGRLQISEAQKIDSIDLSTAGITQVKSLAGIEHFAALKYVDISNNIGISGAINVLENKQLTHLICSGAADITSFILPESILLLDCSGTNVEALPLKNCKVLKTLICDQCHNLSSISLPASLKVLSVRKNHFPELDLTGCHSLEKLDCSDCEPFEVLKLPASLKSLHIDKNKFGDLNLNGCLTLEELSSSDCQYLEEIILPPSMKRVICKGNKLLSKVDVSDCEFLEMLDCSGADKLVTLDVSRNLLLQNLITISCSNLTTIYMRANHRVSVIKDSHSNIAAKVIKLE